MQHPTKIMPRFMVSDTDEQTVLPSFRHLISDFSGDEDTVLGRNTNTTCISSEHEKFDEGRSSRRASGPETTSATTAAMIPGLDVLSMPGMPRDMILLPKVVPSSPSSPMFSLYFRSKVKAHVKYGPFQAKIRKDPSEASIWKVRQKHFLHPFFFFETCY